MTKVTYGPFDFGPPVGPIESGDNARKPVPLGKWSGRQVITRKDGSKWVVLRSGTPLEPGAYVPYNDPEEPHNPGDPGLGSGDGGIEVGGQGGGFVAGDDPEFYPPVLRIPFGWQNREPFGPREWDTEINEENRMKVLRAFDIVKDDFYPCFSELYPEYADCVFNAFKNARIYEDNDIATMQAGKVDKSLTQVAINNKMYKESDRVFARELFHELIHECLVALYGESDPSMMELTELDAEVIEMLCASDVATTPEQDAYFTSTVGLNSFMKDIRGVRISDNPEKLLLYTPLFIWDPETGEVWKNDNPGQKPPIRGELVNVPRSAFRLFGDSLEHVLGYVVFHNLVD